MMKDTFIQCLKKELIDHHGFKHVTINGMYQKRVLEFIGYKKCGEEFKGVAEFNLRKKKIVVNGHSVVPYAPLFIEKERTFSCTCE
jgi:hypothetical protein